MLFRSLNLVQTLFSLSLGVAELVNRSSRAAAIAHLIFESLRLKTLRLPKLFPQATKCGRKRLRRMSSVAPPVRFPNVNSSPKVRARGAFVALIFAKNRKDPQCTADQLKINSMQIDFVMRLSEGKLLNGSFHPVLNVHGRCSRQINTIS